MCVSVCICVNAHASMHECVCMCLCVRVVSLLLIQQHFNKKNTYLIFINLSFL